MIALKLVGLLLLLSLVGLSSPSSASQPRGMELSVCPQGPPKCDFSKIQQAIDAAPEGATIRVGEGTYVESVIIRKSLRLIGVGQEKVRLKLSMPQKPMYPGLSIVIEATKEPIQVWIEGLSLGELDAATPNPDDERGWGIYIGGWAQVILQRLTISGYTLGLFVAAQRREGELPPLLLKPQVIIHEANISHNFFGISTGLVPVHILSTILVGNEVGIHGSEFLLKQSTITKNRLAGIWAHLSPWRLGIVEIRDNLISENGVGILLDASFPPEPRVEGIKSFAVISFNRLFGNQEYGVAILTASCPLPELEKMESAPIQVEGFGNEMRDNQKGDLCPADYPWPPGFKKP